MTPKVIKFVEAQKIKEIETVESFYKKKISKHKKIITPKKRKIINTIKN